MFFVIVAKSLSAKIRVLPQLLKLGCNPPAGEQCKFQYTDNCKRPIMLNDRNKIRRKIR